MPGVLLLRFHVREKVVYDAWYFNGLIDEVRVEGKATDPDRIKLCSMNQKSDDTLVKFRE